MAAVRDYKSYFEALAKAEAVKARAKREQDQIKAQEKAARRIAIQPQLDALAEESTAAFKSGSYAAQKAVGEKIDALLASIN